MSFSNYFLDNQVLDSDDKSIVLELSKDDFKHAKAQRLRTSEHIGVVDANGNLFDCEVAEITDKLVIEKCTPVNVAKKPYKLYLCPGLTKGSKLDDVFRACTEIGIDCFIPVNFERTIVKYDEKKSQSHISRWQSICKSASMQSGRVTIPKVHDIVDVPALCNNLKNFDLVILCWEEATSMQDLINAVGDISNKPNFKVAIIIGPEGGISQEEVNKITAICDNVYSVKISDTILRSQTASITAVSIVSFLLESNGK